jgi:cation diffusion facilitator family transporter
MTQWLMKTFIKNNQNTNDSSVRSASGRMASLVGVSCNVSLALGKFLIALLSGSVSIMADAVNNLSDAASSIISLLGFKMAAKPADVGHPYGHARYEYLAGLTVAVLIMVIGAELVKTSLDKVLHPAPVLFGWLTVGVLCASILVKLWMASFYRSVGKAISSQTLFAASADSRNDVITTSAVLIAALASHFLKVELDGYIGLAVAGYILYSGFGLVRDTLDPLLGTAPDPAIVREIRERIMGYPGVLGTHDLMIHDYGPGRRFGSVHVEMPAEEDILQSHDVIDNIERDFLRDRQLHMIVHLDPIVTKDPAVLDLRRWLADEVKTIHPQLTIHDLRMVKGHSHTNVIFDCVRPPDLQMSDQNLKQSLSALLTKKNVKYYAVITLDDSYAAIPK